MALLVSIILFAGALTVIGVVFLVAYIESRRGALVLPRAQAVLDGWAQGAQREFGRAGRTLDNWPTVIAQVLYYAVHVAAVAVALLARAAEKRAHKVADFVSHRRSFTQHETKSNFLKEVRKHKQTLEIPENVGEIE